MSIFYSTKERNYLKTICEVKDHNYTNILYITLKFVKYVNLMEYTTSVLIYKVKYKLFRKSVQRLFCSKKVFEQNKAK